MGSAAEDGCVDLAGGRLQHSQSIAGAADRGWSWGITATKMVDFTSLATKNTKNGTIFFPQKGDLSSWSLKFEYERSEDLANQNELLFALECGFEAQE